MLPQISLTGRIIGAVEPYGGEAPYYLFAVECRDDAKPDTPADAGLERVLLNVRIPVRLWIFKDQPIFNYKNIQITGELHLSQREGCLVVATASPVFSQSVIPVRS